MSERGFAGLLMGHAASDPGSVAIRERHLGLWRDITWRELAASVGVFAAILRKRGVTTGSVVAVVGRPSRQWLVAELAALSLGARVYAIADRPTQAAAERLATVPEPSAVVVALADARRSAATVGDIAASVGDRTNPPAVLGVVVAAGEEAVLTDDGFLTGILQLPTAGAAGGFRWVAAEEMTVVRRWTSFLERFGLGPSDRVVAGGSLDLWVNRLALLTTLLVGRCVLHFNDDGVADQETRVQVRPTLVWATAREWRTLADRVAAEYAAAGPVARIAYRPIGRRSEDRALPAAPRSRLRGVLVVWPMMRQAGLGRVRVAWSYGDRLSAVAAGRLSAWGISLWDCFARAEEAGVLAARDTGRAGAQFAAVDAVQIPEEIEDTSPTALLETAVRDSPLISEAVAFPDGERAVLLVEPSIPALLSWARSRQLQVASVDRLIRLPDVRERLAGEISLGRGAGLPVVEDVLVVPDLESTPAGSMLSRAGRPCRSRIAEMYLKPHDPLVSMPGA